LRIDYALHTVDPDWRMVCHCGRRAVPRRPHGRRLASTRCSGALSRHFSPFINRRVERLGGS
jgi:hypothetical protein